MRGQHAYILERERERERESREQREREQRERERERQGHELRVKDGALYFVFKRQYKLTHASVFPMPTCADKS